MSPDLAETVLKPSGKSLKQLRNEALLNQQFEPVFIDNATVTHNLEAIHETKQTENVLGFLPGSDPDLKSQVVVFTAHYDHLGKNLTVLSIPVQMMMVPAPLQFWNLQKHLQQIP